MKANKSLLVCRFDAGSYAQWQLLKWDAHCWQSRTMVGPSWSGRGNGPAALSLAPGCSCRQGHMPEGELASLLPVPPGAFLKPLLFFLVLVHHLLIIQRHFCYFLPWLSQTFLCLFHLFDAIVHFFSLSRSLTRQSTSSLLLSSFVFTLYISEKIIF